MTPAQFRDARKRLGLTGAQLARILDVDSRSVQKWELSERKPNPIACRVLSWMLDGYRPPEWPGDSARRIQERERET